MAANSGRKARINRATAPSPEGPSWEKFFAQTRHVYKPEEKLRLSEPYEPLSNTGIIRRIKLQDKI